MKKPRKLFVIVDMVNGFINEGALADKNINKITPNIVKLTKSAIKNNTKIIAFKDTHIENDPEFSVYPPHCIKGTSECDLIPELKPFENYFSLIEKNTTNGFNTQAFQTIIKNVLFDEVVVVGCCTDICVEAFATSLQQFNKDHNRKTKVTVIEDAVYTFNSKEHNAEEAHSKAVKRMLQEGITMLRVGEKIDEKTY